MNLLRELWVVGWYLALFQNVGGKKKQINISSVTLQPSPLICGRRVCLPSLLFSIYTVIPSELNIAFDLCENNLESVRIQWA